MTWEDNLRQEINNAGCFTESEVNDLVMVFQDKIREIMIELFEQTKKEEPDPEGWIMIVMSKYKEIINKLLSERGIESI